MRMLEPLEELLFINIILRRQFHRNVGESMLASFILRYCAWIYFPLSMRDLNLLDCCQGDL